MKLYLKSLKLHLKVALEYKSSFIMSFIAQIFFFFSYYFVILALFDKFNNIKGFTIYEVLLCFGIIHIGFAFNETFARGIDHFEEYIAKGTFDLFLLRPKNILLQILVNDADYIKLSRVLQAVIVLVIALCNLDIEWNVLRVITLILMIISSILIFFSIFILAASYCFVTIQGLEVRNAFTDGGKYLAQYPIGVFNKGIMFIFTFIIPYGLINYYPLLYFIGKTDQVIYAFSPLLIILYLIPCIKIFYIGVKKYSSVGC